MNINFLKISSSILAAFIVALCAYIFFSDQKPQSNLSNKEILLKNFKSELKTINEQLPRDIDNFTTLTSVKLGSVDNHRAAMIAATRLRFAA